MSQRYRYQLTNYMEKLLRRQQPPTRPGHSTTDGTQSFVAVFTRAHQGILS